MKIDYFAVIIGAVQLFVSLFIGVFYIFFAYWFFKKMTTTIDDTSELKKNNVALALFLGAVLFSVVWITRHSIIAGMEGLSLVMGTPGISALINYLIITGILLLQVFLSGTIAFFSIWLAVRIFMVLTRNIDEMNEIKGNNMAIAIIIAVLIIGISLFIEPAIKNIMNGLVPYPVVDILPRK